MFTLLHEITFVVFKFSRLRDAVTIASHNLENLKKSLKQRLGKGDTLLVS